MIAATKIKNRSDKYQQVIDACKTILRLDPVAQKAREYLDSRISKISQNSFEFGYFPDNSNLDYLLSLVDKDVLEDLNVLYPKYRNGGMYLNGHFNRHNLIMPFRDVHGNIVSLLGRTLLSSDEQKKAKLQKYKYTIGAHKELHVFGLNKAKQSIIEKNCAICVEGQFDAISCYEACIDNVVAFGWAYCSRYQFFQLRKYTNNLVLLLDNDDAGAKGRLKLKERYGEYARIIGQHPPKDFKDIDAFLHNSDDVVRKQRVINNIKNFCVS